MRVLLSAVLVLFECLSWHGGLGVGAEGNSRHFTVTDGVDVVTWRIGHDLSEGGGNLVDLRLTCDIERLTQKLVNDSEQHDVKIVNLHKNLCDSHVRRKRAIIAPGTKWCGSGSLAKNRQDLGYFKEVDDCCRTHDFCPISIDGKTMKYGVYNGSPFTMSSCVCDKEFRRCLLSVGNVISNLIGSIYFNVLPSRCLVLPQSRGFRATTRQNDRYRISMPSITTVLGSLF